MKNITSDSRPHFIPGVYSWLAENFARVHFVVLTDHPGFMGPPGLPLAEQILPVANPEDCTQAFACKFKTVTLNLGANAIGKFLADAEGFEVTMRFNGQVSSVYIPFEAVHSVYTPDSDAISAFSFILRPGQERYSIEGIAEKDQPPVANDEVVRETPKMLALAGGAGGSSTTGVSEPRTGHLTRVK